MGSKNTARVFGIIAFALLSISGGALYESQHPSPQVSTMGANVTTPPPNSFSIITEPQDGITPLEQMIESASSSIELVMYEFQDKTIEQLLAQRAKEGIAVRVILDNGYFGAGSSINEPAFDYLQSNDVQVHWSPTYFALTHQKTLIVDNSKALIMTFNLSPQYYKSDRDFGVGDTDPNDVAAIESAFNSDWNGQNFAAPNGDDLVWSPNSRAQLLSLINSATSSLEIYNEEMQDPQIISALSQAAERGVNVEVDMTYSSEWKSAFQTLTQAGVHIRTYKASATIYIHAKMIIADDKEAFVGSENFSTTSLDQNRELGVILADLAVVNSLDQTFEQDWQGASPFLVQ